MGEVLKKHSDGRFSLSHKESGWWIGDSDHDKVKAHKGEQILSKLSIKNCEAIANDYDLDELADEIYSGHVMAIDWQLEKRGFKEGFQKSLEILGDKKFSSGQLLNAMDLVWQWMNGEDYGCKTLTEVQDKHIQSLQQTEWDVEVEMEYNPINHASGLEFTGHKLMDFAISQNYQPKLDADGCIILKRK